MTKSVAEQWQEFASHLLEQDHLGGMKFIFYAGFLAGLAAQPVGLEAIALAHECESYMNEFVAMNKRSEGG